MASLTKASVLIVASTLMLTAAYASKPDLQISRFSASGKPKPCFVSGEIPTLQYTIPYANVGDSASSGCVIKLRQQPDDRLVWRDYVPSTVVINGAVYGDLPNNLVGHGTDNNDSPVYEELLIPGLEAGNYTAEIWVKGRLQNSLKFSVSGRTDYVDNSPVPRRVSRTPQTAAKPSAGSKVAFSKNFIDFSVKRLDAFVGLTDRQKAEVTAIYAAVDSRMLAIPSSEEGIPAHDALRREIREQIRTRLTPEQQKLYDDDRSPGPSVNPQVAKLDELVNLTPGQKALAEKIFANEMPALEKIASSGERTTQEMDLRQKISAQIRTLLTPKQQLFYDVAPQSFGGGRVTRVASNQ